MALGDDTALVLSFLPPPLILLMIVSYTVYTVGLSPESELLKLSKKVLKIFVNLYQLRYCVAIVQLSLSFYKWKPGLQKIMT